MIISCVAELQSAPSAITPAVSLSDGALPHVADANPARVARKERDALSYSPVWLDNEGQVLDSTAYSKFPTSEGIDRRPLSR
jgi:hypothetical protein